MDTLIALVGMGIAAFCSGVFVGMVIMQILHYVNGRVWKSAYMKDGKDDE